MTRYLQITALAIVVLVTLVIYWPGMNGPFVLDDIYGIKENRRLQMAVGSDGIDWRAAFRAGYNGQEGRGISMVSFALNLYWTGDQPKPFKELNLVLHLVNGLGIGLVTWLLLQPAGRPLIPNPLTPFWVALAVMAAWLWHPINLTSVLYVIQRMNSLSALWVILGLIFYLLGRRWIDAMRPIRGWSAICAGLGLMTALAWLSKENGILLPAFALIAEIFLLRLKTPRDLDRRLLISLFGFLVIPPIVGGLLYWAFHPDWLGYGGRLFTLPERLLTEARAIWYYLYLMLPLTHNELGLFHDDFAVSTELVSPPSTSWALLGMAGLLAAIPWAWRHRPLLGFGLAVFLVGHGLESTVIPLELVFEHRNYLPSWGIFLSLVGLMDERLFQPPWRLAVVILVLFSLVGWGQATRFRAGQWSDRATFVMRQLNTHPESVRANHEAGMLFVDAQMLSRRQGDSDDEAYFHDIARQRFLKAQSLKQNVTGSLIGLLITDDFEGRETEGEWMALLLRRLSEQPLQATAARSVLGIAQCHALQACGFSTAEVLGLIDALLRNERLRGNNRMAIERSANIIKSIATINNQTDRLPQLVSLANTNRNEPFFLFLVADELYRRGRFEDAASIVGFVRRFAGTDEWLAKPLQELRARLADAGFQPDVTSKSKRTGNRSADVRSAVGQR
jgi:hypothetical protein